MAHHETVREMTRNQLKDIIATMVGVIPDLSFDEAQDIIGDKGSFVADIRGIFEKRRNCEATLKRDMRKEGWKLLEHTPRRLTSVVDLKPVSFLKQGESYINGEEMVRRARVELDANYSQEDAEWLLKHEEKIPRELRNFYLPFTGTVWQDSYGHRHVPCLYWVSARWFLSFSRLADVWFSLDRLVRPRK